MEIAKVAFVAGSCIIGGLAAFGAGIYVAHYQKPPFLFLQQSIKAIRETPVVTPFNHLQPTRRVGDGVTINTQADDGALILLSGFFDEGNELRLIRRDGTIVARWPVRFSELFPDTEHLYWPPLNEPPATDWNIDTHGALIEPDGSVVFNFEHGGLVKLDRCGDVAWTLAHPTHHSVERATDGGYWVPGRRFVLNGQTRFPPFTVPYIEDLILKVSSSGKIERTFSVPEILYDGGLKPLLTTNAKFNPTYLSQGWDRELVHLNKVGVLEPDRAGKFPLFDEGDLLLSIREMNLVLVVDSHTLDVKWHQTGPWLRQHDPEFDEKGNIVVFNNNIFRDALLPGDKSNIKTPRISNIISVNPVSGETVVEFGGKSSQEFLSVIRGKVDLTDDGGFLITEFEAGRVFEVNEDGKIVWEYINRYDEENVAEITEARLYREGFFKVADWVCR